MDVETIKDFCRKVTNTLWSKSPNLEWKFHCAAQICSCMDSVPLLIVEFSPSEDVEISSTFPLIELMELPCIEEWCDSVINDITLAFHNDE